MKQREVTDSNSITWTCNQAYSEANGNLAKKAEKLIKAHDGKVPIVCTPSGGEQSVRLKLHENWLDTMSDADLMRAIEQGKVN